MRSERANNETRAVSREVNWPSRAAGVNSSPVAREVKLPSWGRTSSRAAGVGLPSRERTSSRVAGYQFSSFARSKFAVARCESLLFSSWKPEQHPRQPGPQGYCGLPCEVRVFH